MWNPPLCHVFLQSTDVRADVCLCRWCVCVCVREYVYVTARRRGEIGPRHHMLDESVQRLGGFLPSRREALEGYARVSVPLFFPPR